MQVVKKVGRTLKPKKKKSNKKKYMYELLENTFSSS